LLASKLINGCESRRGQQEESKGGIYSWVASLKKISTKGRKKKPREVLYLNHLDWVDGLSLTCELGWALSRAGWAGSTWVGLRLKWAHKCYI
jgi:hypothetical protein